MHEKFYRKMDPMVGVYHRTCGHSRVLVFIGDSYTLGQGVLPAFKNDEHYRITNNHNYSHYFAKNFTDVDLINVGIGGASNETILDSLYWLRDELAEYDEVLVLFGTTSPIRTPLILDNRHVVELGLSTIHREEFGVDEVEWKWYNRYREAYHMVGTRTVHCAHKFAKVLVGFQDHCLVNGYDWLIFPTFDADSVYDIFEDPQHMELFGKYLDERKIITDFGKKESAVDVVKRHALKQHGNDMYYEGLDTHFSAEGYAIMSMVVYNQFKTMGYDKW